MTVTFDTMRVDAVAAALERQHHTMTGFATYLRELGGRMQLAAEVRGGATLCDEAADEISATVDILRARLELAEFADEWTAGFEPAEASYSSAVRRLRDSLDDRVGGTGDGDDALRLVAGDVLGSRVDDPRDPAVVTRVLDAAGARDAARFWLMLGVDGQDAAIDHSTAAVSDRFLAGDIHLDAAQIVALRSQPVSGGRGPTTGVGTDWAGTPVADDERVVWAYDRELEPFAGGLVCSLIQAASPIPAPLSTDPAGFSVDAASTAKQLRDLAREGSFLIPSTSARSVPLLSLFAGLVDLGLCRLGVGSGYPIDTTRTVTEHGEAVYAGSRSPSQPYMDRNGLPLDPDPRKRDEQMWRAEHNVENGNWAPYPGFPAYDVNAVGYEG